MVEIADVVEIVVDNTETVVLRFYNLRSALTEIFVVPQTRQIIRPVGFHRFSVIADFIKP